MQVNVPNIEFVSVSDAKKTLEDLGLKTEVKGEGETVYKQMPQSVTVERGSTVILYTDENYTEELVTVPDIKGLSRQAAKEALEAVGLNLSSQGNGIYDEGAVASDDQSCPALSSVPVGTAVSVTFEETEMRSW